MPYSSWDDGASQNKFAFGMMISFEFLQPKNGKINGQDMVFSFSGDDDVWVFIDNNWCLILEVSMRGQQEVSILQMVKYT